MSLVGDQEAETEKEIKALIKKKAADPRFKQFHMDIALHGDYMYFTDLKNNAVERFNWKKAKAEGEKGLKVEQYGPAEFYSLIYMYAVTEESYCL